MYMACVYVCPFVFLCVLFLWMHWYMCMFMCANVYGNPRLMPRFFIAHFLYTEALSFSETGADHFGWLGYPDYPGDSLSLPH